jgi:hypothetical protein
MEDDLKKKFKKLKTTSKKMKMEDDQIIKFFKTKWRPQKNRNIT